MIDKNLVEEYFDFLDGPVWYSIVQIIKTDCVVRRRQLLTSTTLTDIQRYGHVHTLSTYKVLCEKIYQVAGKRMPPELLELFTGDTKE